MGILASTVLWPSSWQWPALAGTLLIHSNTPVVLFVYCRVDGVAEKMERKRSKETMDFRLGACCDEISFSCSELTVRVSEVLLLSSILLLTLLQSHHPPFHWLCSYTIHATHSVLGLTFGCRIQDWPLVKISLKNETLALIVLRPDGCLCQDCCWFYDTGNGNVAHE